MMFFGMLTLLLVGRSLTMTLANPVEDNSDHVLKDIKELRTEVDKLKEMVKGYHVMPHNVNTLNNTLQRFKPNVAAGPNDVYFTVDLSRDATGIAPGEIVKYNHIVTNGGSGYDNTTGVFTVPTDGVYLLAFFCNSLKAQTTTLSMMQNGYPEANCIVEPSFDGEDETGGDVYITRLTIGDRIWVEAFYTEHGTVDLQKNVNTFAGVLIHR